MSSPEKAFCQAWLLRETNGSLCYLGISALAEPRVLAARDSERGCGQSVRRFRAMDRNPLSHAPLCLPRRGAVGCREDITVRLLQLDTAKSWIRC